MQARSTNLSHAIANLYVQFADAPKPGQLGVCTGCCMDPAMEKEILRLPLKRLEAKHFYEYNDAAAASETFEEMQFFAPRMLELLAQGEMLHHSTEIMLQRMKPMQLALGQSEAKDALTAFALAYFAEILQSDPLQARESAFEILVMFYLGGFEIQPLLDYWANDESQSATLHYALLDYWSYGKFNNAFCDRSPLIYTLLEQWIKEPSNRAKFEQRLLDIACSGEAPNLHLNHQWGMTVLDIVELAFQRA